MRARAFVRRDFDRARLPSNFALPFPTHATRSSTIINKQTRRYAIERGRASRSRETLRCGSKGLVLAYRRLEMANGRLSGCLSPVGFFSSLLTSLLLPPLPFSLDFILRSMDRPFFYFRFESKKRHHLRDEKGFNGKSKERRGKEW